LIPYGKQHITHEDIQVVIDVLKSDFLTQGPVVPNFEKALSTSCGAEFVTVLNSATSALHVACLALGLQPNDCVWTVPNTFVASANCALFCGASVDFVDIDPKTYNISIDALELKLKLAKASGRLPKIVIPVHFGGEPCDMGAIKVLSNKYGFKIIEDASHAIGGRLENSAIGACQYSDITVFSFHPVKIVTSGEGGAALTNDSSIDHKLKLLRSHGITRDKNHMEFPKEYGWYYEQIDLGFNYRMTDIQAALGLSQLSRLNDHVKKRHEIAKNYDEHFVKPEITLPYRNPKNLSALHLYVIQVDESMHNYIFSSLRDKGIGVNLHYIPVHTQPYYQKLGFKWGDFPNAEKYYRQAISLPIFPTLVSDQQNLVIESIRSLCDV